MKRNVLSPILTLSLICSMLMVPVSANDSGQQTRSSSTVQAVYLGIEDFEDSDGDSKDSFTYRFSVDGREKVYSIAKDECYSIQNQLQEGYVYDISVKDGTVIQTQAATESAQGEIKAVGETSITVGGETIPLQGAAVYRITSQAGGAEVTQAKAADLDVGKTVKVYGSDKPTIYLTFVAEEYTAPVSGAPGKTTLKNLLATALEPVGTSLYIYGGAWDWQDAGSSVQATTIGLPKSWVDFFQAHDADYTYKKEDDPAHSYYWRGYNEYYFGGPDCSGYIGWVIYNLMNTESGNQGYVMSASNMAASFAEAGWGQLISGSVKDFRPGDIFSMSGHVWMCLGTCSDGSVVFLHSTPSDSKTGQPGGGVQLSALDPNGNSDCQAYQLASYYMTTYYPQWSERYDAVLRDYESYTTVPGGQFRWDLSGVLRDPDGYASLSADEILADLFGELPSDAWYAQAVEYVLDHGLMAGTGAAGFSPETLTSRGTLVTTLYSLAGKPMAGLVSFPDVDSGAWYAQAVAWAAGQGIVDGYSDGTFGPNNALTREQMAVILYRFAQSQGMEVAADSTLSGFSDQNKVQEWARPAMEWAVSAGLIAGTDQGALMPQAGVTRAQAAVILMRFCQQMDV